jgi:enoyl-CoA hydratase/carnithine racemase
VSGEVRLERTGPVGWAVFDHPKRRNALTAAMMGQFLSVLDQVAADQSIRVLVLRGGGELTFVSGADISAFGSPLGVEAGPRPEDVTAAVSGLAKPVVAALRGWCLGAGVLLALAADLRVAGDDLRIGIPAAKLGVAYPRRGVDRLVALAGPAVATEMLMTGEPYDAAGALDKGLVNRVVPAVDLFDHVQRTAEELAANAPLTIAAAKLTIAAVQEPDDQAASAAADGAISNCFRSEDFQEGQRAFAEKRAAVFKGR